MPPPPALVGEKLHVEDSPRRVRVLFGGQVVMNTSKSKLVWEKPYYPTYFFNHDDLDAKYLQKPDSSDVNDPQIFDLVVGERRAKQAVAKYNSGQLEGLLKITFGAMDAWFEEEEQIFVHPKDPYKRVDVLHSARHVRVEVNGVEVANTHAPILLFETTLPCRTYIRKTDCRLDLLRPSELTTQCPYKGEANYYHVQLDETGNGALVRDIVWWYQNPTLECALIRGYVAFYDEKVDVWVDGVKQKRPVTHF
ncbi:hypothetical protein HGRIS_004529 [Hohenbuehelia grisea]|uniref:DUF427 domain-containing protein n=1 Tax=Hohenbuehelia grisea TaxID=104357 RepID=A0ABR3JC83_9AGAR